MPSETISGFTERTTFDVKTCVLGRLDLSRWRRLLGWLALTMLWTSIPGAGQISPGPLSRAHQSLDGATNCTTCHQLSTGEATFKCLSCHTEIAFRIAARKGLHASFNIQPGSSQGCVRCHSEHNGEDFALVKWDLKAFDHKQTGYPLEGKHSGLNCDQCHKPERIAQGERAAIKVKDLSKTFLGVSQSCATCHQDQHNGRLGPDCVQCHNYSDWKAIRVGKFDHSKTRYPLTGLHAEVGCQECHTPGPDQKPRYAGISFGQCVDCHSDPHRGGFEQSCETCHNTSGWKRFSASALDQIFDHSKTKFPLLGKHAAVDCVLCHAGADFKKPLVFKQCMDCHKPDPHGGQFAKRLNGSECASCHTVNGFKPSTFGLKEHAATGYPLEGKHAALQCEQCHIPKGANTVFKMKFAHCTDCHGDEHAGQFAGAPYLNACERCHTLQRLSPSTFGLARHKEARFSLTGSHVAVACSDCHKPSADFKPKPAAIYHWQSFTCTTCHVDPHRGQFAKLMNTTGPGGKVHGCEVCHSTNSWKELSQFDHSKTSFPLLGAHQTAACRDCHKPANPGIKFTNVDFKVAPTKCESCHADIHGKQFAKSGVTACAECHDSAKWKPSLFDHDTRTSFALQGAHRKVSCESCHKTKRTVEGKAVLFYKPTPKECSDCHGSGTTQKNASVN